MYKQVIVVRKDLKLSRGKLAAQASHASVSSALKVMKSNKKIFNKWLGQGQKKIVLYVKNTRELNKLCRKARKLKIPFEKIRDMGLTEVKKGTLTCVGFGPFDEKIINKVTGSLPLFK